MRIAMSTAHGNNRKNHLILFYEVIFMFRGRRGVGDRLRCELCAVLRLMKKIIPAMIAGGVLIAVSWIVFGGPCRVALFFRIPGGGFTVAMYYILWLAMFAAAGGECVLICTFRRRSDEKILLYHLAAHMCLLLWYPLFFTAFSQFLALLLIIAAEVLIILELSEGRRFMYILPLISAAKLVIVGVFIYINLAFLFLNP